MADRIDLHVTVSAVPLRALSSREAREGSGAVRERVERARGRQRIRYARLGAAMCNGRAPGRWLDTETPIESGARALLACAAERLGLSARGYHRVLRVARTIADLDDEGTIRAHCVTEALRYRPASPDDGQAGLSTATPLQSDLTRRSSPKTSIGRYSIRDLAGAQDCISSLDELSDAVQIAYYRYRENPQCSEDDPFPKHEGRQKHCSSRLKTNNDTCPQVSRTWGTCH